MLTAFLHRVWGGQKGYAFLAYLGPDGIFRQKAFSYPDNLEKLIAEALKYNEWAGIYFCPHLFREATRQKEFAMPLAALWIDKDAGLTSQIKPRPTICWETSEGKYQAVWILNKPVDPVRGEKACRYLTYLGKGDKGGWGLGKVIRFPGSMNYKYAPPYQGSILWDDGPTYSIEELEPGEETLTDADKTDLIPKTLAAFTLLTQQEAYSQYGKLIPHAAWDILSKSPAEGEDWSEPLWRLEHLLLESGIPPAVVLSILHKSPWDKYARDNRPVEDLWREISKASLEHPTSTIDSPQGLTWLGLDTMLAHMEKPSWLVEGIWMEKNCGWIVGEGKSYKSMLSLDLALSIASGKPFLSQYAVKTPGPVLMLQEEDPPWRVANRVRSIAYRKGLAGAVITEKNNSLNIFLPKQEPVPIYFSIGGGFHFRSKEKIGALEKMIDKIRPRILFLDPFFMLSPGIDEFKSGDITEVLLTIKHWRNQYDCAVAIVHHNRKSAGEVREKIYGSMALYAWSENTLFIERRRDTNVVVIERDVKDALLSEPIGIKVNDIDATWDYEIVAVHNKGDSTGAEAALIKELQIHSVGTEIPRTSLGILGFSDHTLSVVLNRMAKQGVIELIAKGQGGKQYVKILPPLKYYGGSKEEFSL